MKVSGDYDRILVDNFKEELEWLEDEFDLLFKHKKNYSKDDIALGNLIIEKVIDNISSNDSEELINLLTITLNRIEQTYSEFF
ncbi:hypothetical protein LCGC14_1294660 [marine sediment metagenome]|uniref:Uncharacterized protein n=1 Tax=marine sediment metagenome TaxID=412755 RepID=A0A0F9N7Y3_9ZZZZ